MNMHPTASSMHMFDQIVCLKLENGWCYVESGEQALACLKDRFSDETDPSWQRAHSTCSAFLLGRAGAQAAKNTFIVAAMAAGIGFEVATSFEVVERHVEEAARESLASILFSDEDGD